MMWINVLRSTILVSLRQQRGVPWNLKRVIEFSTKRQAIQAESWIKRMKSRKVIEKIISGEIDLNDIINRG